MTKLKIYLDNCCYNRPFDNQKDRAIREETRAKMFLQALIRYNSIDLVYSSISLHEVFDSPFEENRASVLEFIEHNARYYVSQENNAAAISLTKEIMQKGIKLKDASHVACAVLAKCDYLITTDKRLLKYTDERISIVNPIDFVEKWKGTYE